MDLRFRCIDCSNVTEQPLAQRCGTCGGILEAVIPHPTTSRIEGWSEGSSMWRYASSLPVARGAPRFSFGEGGTPLIEVPKLAERMDLGQLWLKLESVNPTGSFKDRGLSVAITHANYHGAAGLVGSSSGNALHAQAAYAALAGLRSLALVPEAVSVSRLEQPVQCGTRVVRVRGDYSQCHELARRVAEVSGWYNVSTTYENPMVSEGYKTVAYELWGTCGDAVDWIVIPVGAGPLLGAIARGFAEMAAAGACGKAPSLLGVQASRCAPVVRSFEQGLSLVSPWDEDGSSIAKGIADPLRGYAQDGTYTLSAVLRSEGAMIGVSEGEILDANRVLSRGCGLYVDPAAAAAVAGLDKAIREKILPRDASVVVMITGTGFKETGTAASVEALERVLDPASEPIERILRKEET